MNVTLPVLFLFLGLVLFTALVFSSVSFLTPSTLVFDPRVTLLGILSVEVFLVLSFDLVVFEVSLDLVFPVFTLSFLLVDFFGSSSSLKVICLLDIVDLLSIFLTIISYIIGWMYGYFALLMIK